jgi:hypothetical protein
LSPRAPPTAPAWPLRPGRSSRDATTRRWRSVSDPIDLSSRTRTSARNARVRTSPQPGWRTSNWAMGIPSISDGQRRMTSAAESSPHATRVLSCARVRRTRFARRSAATGCELPVGAVGFWLITSPSDWFAHPSRARRRRRTISQRCSTRRCASRIVSSQGRSSAAHPYATRVASSTVSRVTRSRYRHCDAPPAVTSTRALVGVMAHLPVSCVGQANPPGAPVNPMIAAAGQSSAVAPNLTL